MINEFWETIKKEVELRIEAEPTLKDYLENLVLSKSNINVYVFEAWQIPTVKPAVILNAPVKDI